MSVEITKVSSEMYIVNGKSMLLENLRWKPSMLLENLRWKPQIECLTIDEEIAFKQRLNADLFNEKNINYATIGNIRYRRSDK